MELASHHKSTSIFVTPSVNKNWSLTLCLPPPLIRPSGTFSAKEPSPGLSLKRRGIVGRRACGYRVVGVGFCSYTLSLRERVGVRVLAQNSKPCAPPSAWYRLTQMWTFREANVGHTQTASLKLAAACGELALFDCAGYHASVELMHVLRGEKVIRECVQFHRFVESLRFLADLDRLHFSRLGYQYLFVLVYDNCHEDACPKAYAYTWLHKKVVFLERVRDSNPPDRHELKKAVDFCWSANLAINQTLPRHQ